MLLNLSGKGNIYEQIVQEFEKLINIGALINGDRLPSCRQLATKYGINPNTVEKAYKELISLGYIESIPKKGFYVRGQGEDRLEFVRREITKLRDSGVGYEELTKIIGLVYKEVRND